MGQWYVNGEVGIWMDGWVDGWMDGWMDGWVDGWVDGWMGRYQCISVTFDVQHPEVSQQI